MGTAYWGKGIYITTSKVYITTTYSAFKRTTPTNWMPG